MGSRCIEKVTRRGASDGLVAQGRIGSGGLPGARPGAGDGETLCRDRGNGPASKGHPNAHRRPKQPLPRAREEDTELSMAGTEPGARAGLTLPTRDKAAPVVTPKECLLPGPAGDVTGTVISGGEEGRVWAGWGGTRRSAFLRKPLGKHGGEAQTSFLLGSCLQIRLAQPGCCYC